ncbi:MAG TPA: sigma-54 dependent transcriptional regulator [Pyrinomonadaceae bacterium]
MLASAQTRESNVDYYNPPLGAEANDGSGNRASSAKETSPAKSNFAEIVGESLALQRLFQSIETVAPTDATVLILGETGTGKELIAKAIHRLSRRSSRVLVKMNCAAIPAALLEAELFGHERGAFTGATNQRTGRFELAHQATLFLDEIGDMPLELQPKLLRILQEREFERLGSSRTQKTDVRMIAATNQELLDRVEMGEFRRDLYYRLNVFPVRIPPLRERRQDIPILANHFVRKFAAKMNKEITRISLEALKALQDYDYPGNVRELENIIERAVILTSGDTLECEHLRLDRAQPQSQVLSGGGGSQTFEDFERRLILQTLKETGWRIGGAGGAAAKLGLKRTTLMSKMEKLRVSRQLL